MAITPDLTNRIALVTGGSRGIGRAIALALAAAGADVAVNYHERASEASEVVDAIRASGRRAIALGADVSDGDAVAAMMRRSRPEFGPVDVLVNNAGIAIIRGVDDLTEAEFDMTLAVNLKSAFLCTQAVLPGMRARDGGGSSTFHRVPRAGQAASACTTTRRRPGWRDLPVAMRRGW